MELRLSAVCPKNKCRSCRALRRLVPFGSGIELLSPDPMFGLALPELAAEVLERRLLQLKLAANGGPLGELGLELVLTDVNLA